MKFMVFLSIFFSCGIGFSEESMESALEKYGAAERSGVQSEKEALFNDSLKFFLEYAKKKPSGKLFYNIGNTYFYLGDYGSAIAFYRKAQKLMPRDVFLRKNLAQAIEQADVQGYQIEDSFIDKVCFQWCSPAERSLMLLGGAIFCFLVFSLNIWFPFPLFGYVWKIAFGGVILLVCVFTWHEFFLAPRAVIVKATVLHVVGSTSSGATFMLRPGEMVEVIGIDERKSWVRVKSTTSVIGYVPGEAVCVI